VTADRDSFADRFRRSSIGGLVGAFATTARRRGVRYAAAESMQYLLRAPARRSQLRLERSFDQARGVDTAGIVSLSKLEISSPNREDGVRYEATSPAVFDDLVSRLEIEFEDFTFVDYGSGKGRVVLLAAELPFKRVIGIDFAPELVAVSRRNLMTYRGSMSCPSVEIHCCDACDFEPPDGPLVLFFFNPFAEPVLTTVLGRLSGSLARSPRPVFILATGPVARSPAFEAAGFRDTEPAPRGRGRVLTAGITR
jgi:hypothetical protein